MHLSYDSVIFWEKKSIKYLLIPFVLLAFSIVLRLAALFQTSYGNGWDAYFYLIQVKALLTEGSMHSADVSLIYPFLLLFKLFINDYVLAYKIAAAFISGLYVISLYYIACEATQGKKCFTNAILIASFAIFSPTITYMVAQFPKNMLALTIFNFFLLFWLKEKKWAMLLFLVLSFFTHRLTAGIIIIFIVFQMLNKRRIIWLLLILGVLTGLSFLLPGLIKLDDAERFKDVFTLNPQFAAYSFIRLFGMNKISIYWIAEIMVLLIVYVFAFILLMLKPGIVAKNLRKSLFILAIICLLLLFPFFRFDINGPAFRFFLSFMVIVPLFMLVIAVDKGKTIKIIMISLLFVASLFSFKSYNPLKFDPPYGSYQKIAEVTLNYLQNKKCEIVIAHKGLAEYITFTKGIDVLPWQPESRYDIVQTFRISSGISSTDFRYYLKKEEMDSIKKAGIDYFILPETIWQAFTEKVKQNDELGLLKIIYSDKNPYRVRPDYLLKK
jgi:hypothetical protein